MLKRYVIERSIPGVGTLPAQALASIAANSRLALESLGPGVQWLQSFVTRDKTYCIYLARDESQIRDHAARAGMPVDVISRVERVVDPTH